MKLVGITVIPIKLLYIPVIPFGQDRAPMGILDLPHDVLLEILSKVLPNTLTNVASVCTLFQNTVNANAEHIFRIHLQNDVIPFTRCFHLMQRTRSNVDTVARFRKFCRLTGEYIPDNVNYTWLTCSHDPSTALEFLKDFQDVYMFFLKTIDQCTVATSDSVATVYLQILHSYCHVDWSIVSTYHEPSIDFLNANHDKLNWEILSSRTDIEIPLRYLVLYRDRINWHMVSKKQHPNYVYDRLYNYIQWDMVIIYASPNEEILRDHFHHIDKTLFKSCVYKYCKSYLSSNFIREYTPYLF